MQIDLFVDNENKTISLGEKLGSILPSPVLIYLEGDLGAGKTHFSKGVAKGLGITEDVTSPTFTLINEYPGDKVNLYHLDLYRLDSLNQVLDLGIEDFIDDEKSIVLIEWAEKLNDYRLSDSIIKINIFHQETGRKFIISADNKYENILKEIKGFADTWH